VKAVVAVSLRQGCSSRDGIRRNRWIPKRPDRRAESRCDTIRKIIHVGIRQCVGLTWNRRIPNGTYWWCERTGANRSLLLDYMFLWTRQNFDY